jgi:uncharacterized protein
MWWIFDFLTLFFLIVVAIFLIEFRSLATKHKHKRCMTAIAVVLGLSWLVIFYGSFIEPKILVVGEEVVELVEDQTESIKVAVLSDIHVGPYKGARWVRYVVERVMTLEPDMIVIPGDFIFKEVDEIEILAPLTDLAAPYGVWAVTGNHDYEDDAAPILVNVLKGLGVQVLENERETIVVGQRELVLAGVSDLWYDGDIDRTLIGVDPEDVVILLSHNPDAVLYDRTSAVDLVIAGHTHGGQIRLPWIGSVPQIPTILGNDYDQGLFDYNDIQLFITSGVGETGPRARLFNPPEINLLTLSL